MNRVLSKNDINLIKVLGDNNCLFNCIIQYIHLNKNIYNCVDNNYTYKLNPCKQYEKLSEDLRQSVVDWLENNLDFILPTGLTIKDDIIDCLSIDDSVDSIEEYLLDMRAYKYAGQIEIYALSNILKKNIIVLTEIDGNYYSLGMGNIYNKNNENIYLFHNMLEQENEDEHHYNLLFLKNKTQIISKKKYLDIINRLSSDGINSDIEISKRYASAC